MEKRGLSAGTFSPIPLTAQKEYEELFVKKEERYIDFLLPLDKKNAVFCLDGKFGTGKTTSYNAFSYFTRSERESLILERPIEVKDFMNSADGDVRWALQSLSRSFDWMVKLFFLAVKLGIDNPKSCISFFRMCRKVLVKIEGLQAYDGYKAFHIIGFLQHSNRFGVRIKTRTGTKFTSYSRRKKRASSARR